VGLRAFRAALLPAALCLAVNLVGLTWGLPARWHPDEKADGVARMARGEGMRPESFVNPSLPLYLELPFVFVQGRLAESGALRGVAADPLLLCRILSALCTALAVLLLDLATRRVTPDLAPWPALFLALAPGAVNLAHFATPEAWLLLLTAGVLLLALEHAAGRCPAAVVGAALGLALSTKYTAAGLGPCVLAAVLLRDRPPADRRDRAWLVAAALGLLGAALWLFSGEGAALAASLHLADARLLHPEVAAAFVRGLGRAAALAGAALGVIVAMEAFPRTRGLAARLGRRELVIVGFAAALAFVAGTPFAAVEPRAFLSDLAFNAQTREEYKGLVGSGTSFLPYLGLLGEAMTWPVLAAALVGAVTAWTGSVLPRRGAVVVTLAAVGPYLLVASSGHRAMRFVAPAFPALAWLAAVGLRAVIRPLRARVVVDGLVLARAAAASALVLRLFLVDSRILAGRWMAANVPPGATLDLIANHAGYAPTLPEGRTLRMVPTLSREMAPVERFREAARLYPDEASPWLILTASFYERFLEHPDQQPERARFFRDLLDGRGGFAVAARFRQEGWLRPPVEFVDPEIVILRKNAPATEPGAR
jgi:hypothetical protein